MTSQEFSERFVKRDIYNQKSKNKLYLLTELENYNNKEKINIEDLLENNTLSIEHIMPQELSDEWKKDLGENWEEIYTKYLHTIGNITLTGYNSEMQNATFIVKRNIEKGYKNSRLKFNKYLAEIEKWDEEEIIKRAQLLKDIALKIWTYPSTDYKITEEQSKFFTLEDEKNFTNEKIVSFYFINEEEKVNTWTDFFISIIKQIFLLDISIFDNIISGKIADSRIEKCFSRNKNNLRAYKEISSNLYVETNLSTEDKLMILRKLIGYIGLELNDVGFNVK